MAGRAVGGPSRVRAYGVGAEPERRSDGGLTGEPENTTEWPDFPNAARHAGQLIGQPRILCVVLDPLREARPAGQRHVFGPEDVVRRLTADGGASHG